MRTPALVALALALGACMRAVVPAADQGAGTGGAAAVRLARTRFNAAIAARDTAAIRALLLASYHIVTGRSTQRHGVAAALDQWATAFRDTSVRYVRTTRAVDTNEAWGLAQEVGSWVGRVTAADGVAESSGVYAAKWQRTAGGQWRLQAETFTTLRCTGGPLGCPPPDPE
jgi:ketosteroid isomerase-like protein